MRRILDRISSSPLHRRSVHKLFLYLVVLVIFVSALWHANDGPEPAFAAGLTADHVDINVLDRGAGVVEELADQSSLGAPAATTSADMTAHELPKLRAALDAAEEADTIRFRGSVSVGDELGRNEAADGTLEVYFECLNEVHELTVRAGLWEYSAAPDELEDGYFEPGGGELEAELGMLEVLRAHLAGREAWSEAGAVALRAGVETELELRWMGVTELRIVDALTGAELDAVDMAVDEYGMPPVNAEQLADSLTLRAQPSPLLFAPKLDDLVLGEPVQTWLVGADGYAWQPVSIDHGRGGERTVELARAGSLRVQLAGETPGTARLVLTPLFDDGLGGRQPGLWPTGPEGSRWARGDRLAPGLWSVALKSGLSHTRAATLVEEQVLIKAGSLARLELTVPELPLQGEPVALAGLLHVPGAWQDLGELMFSIRAVGPFPYDHQVTVSSGHSDVSSGSTVSHLAKVAGDRELRRWQAGRRTPGEYMAEISMRWDRCIWQQSFTLPPRGLDDLELHLPAPLHLAVVPRDAATGQRLLQGSRSLEEAGVSISFMLSDTQGIFGEMPGELNAAEGSFLGIVPQGDLQISVDSHAYGGELVTVDVQEGGRELVIDMHGQLALSIELENGGQPVTVPEEWWWEVGLSDLDGEELDFGMDSSEEGPNGMLFLVSGTGFCRVSFPKLNGYEPLADRDVTLAAGRTTSLALALTSK